MATKFDFSEIATEIGLNLDIARVLRHDADASDVAHIIEHVLQLKLGPTLNAVLASAEFAAQLREELASLGH